LRTALRSSAFDGFDPPANRSGTSHSAGVNRDRAFTTGPAAAGHPLFAPAQISHSRSRRGVVRGVHYTATPPGMAKLVHCPQGRALDFIVDLRTGSPAFGRWESVELDPASGRSAYLPVGVGHLFVALEDDEVSWLYVDPARYGEGAGSALLRHAVAQGGPRVETTVLAGNQRALDLYLRAGFVIVETKSGRLVGNESFPATGHIMEHRKG
jgi:GNAT superfamily N-acetyltransferase